MTMEVVNTDDPPVAGELRLTVYSGRPVTFSLPAYDPDGAPVEIFIVKEPQGASQTLTLTEEQTVGSSGQRRKVDAANRLNPA